LYEETLKKFFEILSTNQLGNFRANNKWVFEKIFAALAK